MATGAFETATRIGFAARGLMYLLIGWLALRTGRAEDGAGIIDYLSSGAGRLVLAGMALGFLAYGGWRLADSWTDSSGRGSDAKGMAVRVGGAVSGILHLGLGIVAALHALSLSAGGGGGDATEQGAATALDLPGGELVLIAVAVGLLLAGLHQLRKAWSLDFLGDLGGPAAARWICWLGRAGFAARGVVFLVIAWFFWSAGRDSSSSEAGGIGKALAALPGTLQTLVAIGLALFGLFSFVEARYRRIPAPQAARAF